MGKKYEHIGNSKKCSRCGEIKVLGEFYRNKNLWDGRMSECIPCKKARDKEVRSRADYRMRRRSWLNKFKKTEKGRLANIRYRESLKRRVPEKLKARSMTRQLKKQPCEICNKLNTHAHHDDYSEPLDVRWFCQEHHNQFHGLGRGY